MVHQLPCLASIINRLSNIKPSDNHNLMLKSLLAKNTANLPLPHYIKLGEYDYTVYPIVDEQHRGLVATINSLYYFIQQGFALEVLKPTIQLIEQYVMFHLKTEETLLIKHGISYEELKTVKKYSTDFMHDMKEHVSNAIEHKEVQELYKFIANWWTEHTTKFHSRIDKHLV